MRVAKGKILNFGKCADGCMNLQKKDDVRLKKYHIMFSVPNPRKLLWVRPAFAAMWRSARSERSNTLPSLTPSG